MVLLLMKPLRPHKLISGDAEYNQLKDKGVFKEIDDLPKGKRAVKSF